MPRLLKARVALDHVVLEVRDPVRSAAFYREVLGLRAGLRALEGRLRRKGIAITHRDPRNFGARGWGSSLCFRDPDEIGLEARYYPAAE